MGLMESQEPLRRRVENQGFSGLSEEEFQGVEPWLRFTPFLTGLLAALGTLGRFSVLLWALAGISLLGVALPRHPFDYLYQNFIRHFENSPPLPPSPRRRRLVYGVQAAGVAIAAWGFMAGYPRMSHTVGWAVAAEAAWLAAHQISLVSEAWILVFARKGAGAGD
jgi:hypothetical protein